MTHKKHFSSRFHEFASLLMDITPQTYPHVILQAKTTKDAYIIASVYIEAVLRNAVPATDAMDMIVAAKEYADEVQNNQEKFELYIRLAHAHIHSGYVPKRICATATQLAQTLSLQTTPIAFDPMERKTHQ